jgi:tripartite-type tricarboxylate transporter receptor subunit TctC
MKIFHSRLVRRLAFTCITATLSILISDNHAWAQARSVKLIIPYPPGGTNEATSRLLVDQIGRAGGPIFIIEDRPGAGTVLATDAVSRAPPGQVP